MSQPGYPQQGGYPPQGQQPPQGYPQQPQQQQQQPQAMPMLDRALVTTGNDLVGFRIVRYLGLVRGLTVRSRSVLGNLAGSFQALVGGKVEAYVRLCETAREEAYTQLMQHAAQMGANAIIGMRYDANEVMDGVTEVLAYGTAVIVQPVQQPQ